MTDDIVTRLRMFSLDDGTDALNKLLAEATDEIERLQAEKSEVFTVGNLLLKFAEADSKCQCRREWVCHRCEAIDAWKSVCNKVDNE